MDRTHTTAIRTVLQEPNVQDFLRTYLPDKSPEEAVLFLNEKKVLRLVEKGRFADALKVMDGSPASP